MGIISYHSALHVPENLKTTSGLSILMHDVISLPDRTSYDKNPWRAVGPTVFSHNVIEKVDRN